MAGDLPFVRFAGPGQMDDWLDAHSGDARGAWVVFAKKGSGLTSLSLDEAVEVALCHGWIDGQLKGIDDREYRIRFTPRTAKSRWSQINRERVARLEAEGRMREAGRAQVEAAKADGRWDAAYAPPSRMTVPDDLRAALNADPRAAAAFAALTAGERYSVLYRLHHTPAQRRAGHVARVVSTLTAGPPAG